MGGACGRFGEITKIMRKLAGERPLGKTRCRWEV
jgi:hypothetical protein